MYALQLKKCDLASNYINDNLSILFLLNYLHYMKKILFAFFVFHFSFFAFAQVAPKFEFRAVWIATVDNIDWPSKKDLRVSEQKAEFIRMLDMHKQNGMNAVIVQVRPAADAFYPSQYEPWSEFLTGKQGTPPYPYYDPLQFMIEETHKRGMEFHAWLNPYRAVFNLKNSTIAPTHVTKIHPEWFIVYGDKKYFNPALQEVRNYVTRIVKDIVTRYDVDGIHMDDYFYPYRITGKEFPDEKTYRELGRGLDKETWRRSNCDSIIKQISETIRINNPRVKFGISPFGVWRNKDKDINGSDTKAGQTNYDDLYANILLWLQKGWIDYVAPQLYWERGHKLCDYDVLLDWWNKHSYGRHLYIGHGIYRAGSNAAWKDKNEIPNQIKSLRNYNTTQGSIFFSSKNLEKNANGWSDSLRMNYYALPALIPSMQWIDSIPPAKPTIEKNKDQSFTINYKGDKKIKAFAVFVIPDKINLSMEFATLIDVITADKKIIYDRNKSVAAPTDRLFVCAVDINNNISKAVELK